MRTAAVVATMAVPAMMPMNVHPTIPCAQGVGGGGNARRSAGRKHVSGSLALSSEARPAPPAVIAGPFSNWEHLLLVQASNRLIS